MVDFSSQWMCLLHSRLRIPVVIFINAFLFLLPISKHWPVKLHKILLDTETLMFT